MKAIVRYKPTAYTTEEAGANTPTTMLFLLRDKTDRPFWCARLDVIDHPKRGASNIRTTEIISFNPAGGIIETINTIYIPETL